MRVLWVGTKSPWPPVDGGRVLSLETIRGLGAAHEVTVVAPVEEAAADVRSAEEALRPFCRPRLVPVAPRSRAASALRAAASGLPFTIGRHARAGVANVVADLLASNRFDVVHAEQLQAFRQCRPALARRVPVVLREQNVESDLWAGLAAHAPFPISAGLRREAARLAEWEGRAARESALTIALTGHDAARLAVLAGPSSRILTIPVPFPRDLPQAAGARRGSPSLVVFGSPNWKPNQDGSRWFLSEIWPALRRHFPNAVAHTYGLSSPLRPARDVDAHVSPENSVEAFAPGDVLVVPLRFASGARMRILEGFARRVPVVATSVAARGLDVADDVHLLVADDVEAFRRALERLATEPGLVAKLVANGSALLGERHDPGRSLAALVESYARAGREGSP